MEFSSSMYYTKQVVICHLFEYSDRYPCATAMYYVDGVVW